ncbi:MAG: hypothetical protein SF053_13910 [Bacteroidia bacterium]|nr:hypothetical protein [Bacteroidia bacterium]
MFFHTAGWAAGWGKTGLAGVSSTNTAYRSANHQVVSLTLS